MSTGPQLDDLGPHRDPLVGTVVGERYRLVRRLGTGGMGAVYEGLHTVIGKKVAVKLLHPQLAGDPDTVARFLNEARAAAMLGHPGIVEALDMGRAPDGAPYLVMEFLQGETLAERLVRQGPLTPGAAVSLCRQAAGALAVAHQKQIVHRDLKPDNIFLAQLADGTEHVKILDFGVSKFAAGPMAAGTRTGSVVGTPAYMAPEQLHDSSRVDARADIYALGVVLYQSLSGKLPFEADTLPKLAERITHEPPPPLDQVRPGVPPPLVELVTRCLAKDPAARFASMEALIQALASLPIGIPAVMAATAISGSGSGSVNPGLAATFITPAQTIAPPAPAPTYSPPPAMPQAVLVATPVAQPPQQQVVVATPVAQQPVQHVVMATPVAQRPPRQDRWGVGRWIRISIGMAIVWGIFGRGKHGSPTVSTVIKTSANAASAPDAPSADAPTSDDEPPLPQRCTDADVIQDNPCTPGFQAWCDEDGDFAKCCPAGTELDADQTVCVGMGTRKPKRR
ncbi:MAG: protein kinase [Deltaproteobacteria bacterium]|nr:protein kinase [Deltaproteobacteria bacterium]